MAALKEDHLFLAIILLLALAIVFGALLKFIVKSIFGAAPQGKEKGDLKPVMWAPLLVLLVIMLGLGIGIPEFLIQLVDRSTEIILGGS